MTIRRNSRPKELGEPDGASMEQGIQACLDCMETAAPLVNSPKDGTYCFDQRTPAEQREFEPNHTEIGHDPRIGMTV